MKTYFFIIVVLIISNIYTYNNLNHQINISKIFQDREKVAWLYHSDREDRLSKEWKDMSEALNKTYEVNTKNTEYFEKIIKKYGFWDKYLNDILQDNL